MDTPAFVGRFEVRDEVSSGSFARVMTAWDPVLEALVALKVLRVELADDAGVVELFLQEARLLRRVRSRFVVAVHDVGRLADGRPYLVMDYADRGTLLARIGPRRVCRPEARVGLETLVDALADGLSAIHDTSVVHRDVKPANILFQSLARLSGLGGPGGDVLVAPDERILLGDLGIAKDLGPRAAATASMIAGTPIYQAPEQADPEAEVTPMSDVYAATATLWHVLTGQRPPSAGEVEDRLATLPEEWRRALATGMARRAGARFPDMGAWRDAMLDALASASPRTAALGATEAAPAPPRCPYKGLAAYQSQDAAFFHGREGLIEEALGRLRLDRVLFLGGGSGSGKSSLMRAGLLPALRAGALPGSAGWGAALFTPGRDPLAALYVQLVGGSGPGGAVASLDQLVAYPGLARHLGVAAGPSAICIDQFEEIFTLAAPDRRRRFVEALSAMTDPADSEVRLVLALRADFYAACAEFPWLADRISHNQILVGPMTPAELRRAVVEPARLAGLRVERALVDAVVDEAGARAGSLPLVAHALYETWTRREDDTLTLDALQAAGGVAGAIAQTADALFDRRFAEAEQAATRRLFLRLTSPGEGVPDTRRRLALDDLGQDAEPAVMRRVAEALVEARLLTVDERSVQIAHEALLQTWPRLRGWIEESRDELRMRQRIARDAAEWDAEGRGPDPLYRGSRLLAALEWIERNPDELGPAERAFVEASAAARDLAEARAAERRRRIGRLRMIVVAGLALLATGASVASLLAYRATDIAERNRLRAEAASREAAERVASALGAVASGLAERDPLLALALGAEAVARADDPASTVEARGALVAARRVLEAGGVVPFGSPVVVGDALAMALSRDGRLMALGNRSGTRDLFDVAGRRWIARSLAAHARGVRDLAFAPDGQRIASAGADGTVGLLVLDGGEPRASRTVGRIDDVAFGIGFDPAGERIAVALGDGTVRFHDAASGALLGPPLAETALAFKAVAFAPNGRGLLATNNDGRLYGWRLPSGDAAFAPMEGLSSNDPVDLAVAPGGRLAAVAGANGRTSLVDLDGGPAVREVFDAADRVGALAFLDDDRLLGGGADGALRVWDLRHEAGEAVAGEGHAGPAIEVQVAGPLAASLGRDQEVRFWRLVEPVPSAEAFPVHGGRPRGIAVSPDGTRLAAGDASGRLWLWTLDGDGRRTSLGEHAGGVWAAAFSPDGTRLATGDRNGTVGLWDVPGERGLGSIDLPDGAIWSLAWLPGDAGIVAAASGGLALIDPGRLTSERVLEAAGGDVTRLSLAPDGRTVAVAAMDGTVRLWDADARAVASTLDLGDEVVWSVAFSRDGARLATASSDEAVALWDVATGGRLALLGGHEGGATDVAFLGDGATLVALDRRGGLHWWDTLTGRRLAEARAAHEGAGWRLAPHPDGRRFATAGDGGAARLWSALHLPTACALAGAVFDDGHRRRYLGRDERVVGCAAPAVADGPAR
ncbi:MAG: WD40 repeat domain-containing serine/threonine protein kinase [Paracoccaceae bacterium]